MTLSALPLFTQLPPPLDTLQAEDQRLLVGYTQAVRFDAGDCIFREGAEGDGCYAIESGEVRLEIDRPELDSEGVLQVLGPGSLLGEMSLLDRLPRSASAYAESDVAARFIPAKAIEAMLDAHPRLGASVLRALGRDASLKLRSTTDRLAQFIGSSDPDPLVEDMVRRADAAQRDFASWDEARVDALLGDLAGAVAMRARELAEATVRETRLGNADDKTRKNEVAAMGVFQGLAGRPGIGLVGEDAATGVAEYASPMGVIFALVPATNPVATAIFKTIIALKGRNAIILSPHRSALGVVGATGAIVHAVLAAHGAPADLVQWVRERGSRKLTNRFMSHPGVALVLATGGAGMVKAAYSSGTPALGVGPGNAPALVCADADLDAAAQGVVSSKAFDNGLICASEHNLVVEASIRAPFVEALERAGAAVLSPEEAARFTAAAVNASGGFRPRIVGQPAAALAGAARVERPYPIRVIVVPTEGATKENPYAGEKMAPVLSLFTVRDADEGVALCGTLLGIMGAGHTAAIHTADEALIARFGREVPASRLVVNSGSMFGACGMTTGLPVSFALGCGTFGGNSTTDNVGYRNLLNIKRLARCVAR